MLKMILILAFIWSMPWFGSYGSVRIKVIPAKPTQAPEVYLGSDKLDLLRSDNLEVAVGSVAITGSGYFPDKYCTLVVRKNRVTNVTLMLNQTPPRCVCGQRDPNSATDKPTCI